MQWFLEKIPQRPCFDSKSPHEMSWILVLHQSDSSKPYNDWIFTWLSWRLLNFAKKQKQWIAYSKQTFFQQQTPLLAEVAVMPVWRASSCGWFLQSLALYLSTSEIWRSTIQQVCNIEVMAYSQHVFAKFTSENARSSRVHLHSKSARRSTGVQWPKTVKSSSLGRSVQPAFSITRKMFLSKSSGRWLRSFPVSVRFLLSAHNFTTTITNLQQWRQLCNNNNSFATIKTILTQKSFGVHVKWRNAWLIILHFIDYHFWLRLIFFFRDAWTTAQKYISSKDRSC